MVKTIAQRAGAPSRAREELMRQRSLGESGGQALAELYRPLESAAAEWRALLNGGAPLNAALVPRAAEWGAAIDSTCAVASAR